MLTSSYNDSLVRLAKQRKIRFVTQADPPKCERTVNHLKQNAPCWIKQKQLIQSVWYELQCQWREHILHTLIPPNLYGFISQRRVCSTHRHEVSNESCLQSTVEESYDEVKLLVIQQRSVTLDVITQLLDQRKARYYTLQRPQHSWEDLKASSIYILFPNKLTGVQWHNFYLFTIIVEYKT